MESQKITNFKSPFTEDNRIKKESTEKNMTAVVSYTSKAFPFQQNKIFYSTHIYFSFHQHLWYGGGEHASPMVNKTTLNKYATCSKYNRKVNLNQLNMQSAIGWS